MKHLLILFLFFVSFGYSQKRIDYIRECYKNANAMIEEAAGDGKACCHEIITNEVLPGSGPSKNRIKIYYSDILNEYGSQKREVIKITKTGNIAAAETSTEFLVDKGEIIFIYSSFKPANDEQRFYFEKDKLIKTIIKTGEGKQTEKNKNFELHKSASLKAEGKKFLKIFHILNDPE